jgi:hypothetical protein
VVLFMAEAGFAAVAVPAALVILVTAPLADVSPLRHVVGHAVSLAGVFVGVYLFVLSSFDAPPVESALMVLGGAALSLGGVAICRLFLGRSVVTWWLLPPGALAMVALIAPATDGL